MFFQKVAAAEDADDSSAGSNYAGSVDGDAALSDDSAPSDNEPGGPSTSKPLVKVISAFYF